MWLSCLCEVFGSWSSFDVCLMSEGRLMGIVGLWRLLGGARMEFRFRWVIFGVTFEIPENSLSVF